MLTIGANITGIKLHIHLPEDFINFPRNWLGAKRGMCGCHTSLNIFVSAASDRMRQWRVDLAFLLPCALL